MHINVTMYLSPPIAGQTWPFTSVQTLEKFTSSDAFVMRLEDDGIMRLRAAPNLQFEHS